jgi:hypothetical protein
MDNTSHLCAKAMLENLLQNLFGKNDDMEKKSPIIYSDVSTTSTEIPGNCTFYGTSNLTIQLTDLDNKVKIQCVEESNLSSESLTIETESITVYCKFSLIILSLTKVNPLVLFLFIIVLSVLLRLTAFD